MPHRRVTILGAALLLLSQAPAFGESPLRTSFSEDAIEGQLVLAGRFTAARKGPGKGSTDFVIDQVLKGNAMVVAPGKVLRIPWDMGSVAQQKQRAFLVVGTMVEGQVEVDRDVLASPARVRFVGGLVKIDPRDRPALLRHCFDHLRHEDRQIADDACGLFAKSSDSDLRKVARMLRPDDVRRGLQDEKERPYRLHLFGCLLGNCGTVKDAVLLRKVLDRELKKEDLSYPDGVLTGYTLLNPKGGWTYTRDLLKDPRREFNVRYLGLRAVDYFWTTRPGVLPEKDLLEGVGLLLEQSDIADLAIEKLRQWKRWEHTQRILTLQTKDDRDGQLIRRAVVRYALTCPDARAARFLDQLRRAKEPIVQAQEELLKLEE